MKISNNILFYSSVKDFNSFTTSGFYVQDIKALEDIGYSVRVTNKYYHFLLFWQYDISFLYFYKKSVIPALISRFFRKKIFFTGGIDQLNLTVTNKYYFIVQKILFKICYILSSKCNIVSTSDLNNTLELLKQKPTLNNYKLSFFPHCIQLKVENASLIQKKNNSLSTICWMGTIENVKRKGVDRCIYFLNELIKYDSSFRLVIIGSIGSGTYYLKNIISDLNLQDFIFFTGEISDKSKVDYLISSKYYLQFSIYEGFGLAVIEAMLCNCLIVHSNAGGLKDTIGENGLIFQNFNDYKNLASCFIENDINYLQYHKKIIENRNIVLDKYSLSARSDYFKNNL